MDPVVLLRRMVEIPSLSGEEGPLARFLADQMAGLGFEAFVDEAGNAVGILGDGPTEIVLLGHMDTVPGAIPARIEGGKLFGRGSVDAKGSLAAFVAAAAGVGALGGKRIVVIGAVEEEAATSKGARSAAARYRPAHAIIGEPSGATAVTLGYKGRLVLRYEAAADAAHSASNAPRVLEEGVEFWNRIRRWAAGYNAGRKMFERLDPALRGIRSENDGLTETVGIDISVRVPLGLTPQEVQRRLEGLAAPGDPAAAGVPQCRWVTRLAFRGHEAPYRADKNTPLVRAFLRAIREGGGEPSFKVKSGTSDMNVVGPIWKCPIVAYGPGDSALDHTPQEHLDLAEYRQAIATLSRVLTLL